VGQKIPKRQIRPTQEIKRGSKTPKMLKPTHARDKKWVENTENAKTNPSKTLKVGRKHPKR
jgi:hypothetical protein